jgi:hypothetical protein
MAGIALTVALLAGAVVIGGGIPLTPAEIARNTRRAADNASTAVDNTHSAVVRTRALERVAAAVRAQVDASHRLLEIQLGIEDSTRRGAGRTTRLEQELAAVGASLDRLGEGLAGVRDLSARAARASETSVTVAAELDRRIDVLKVKFDRVVRESRRLDRKARGYRKLRGGRS